MTQVCAQASNSEDDSEEVLVKEIVFVRPFKDTREVDALKTRRRQMVEMIAVEKNNLPKAQNGPKRMSRPI